MRLNDPLPMATLAEHFADTATGPMLPGALSQVQQAQRGARVLVLFGADWDGR